MRNLPPSVRVSKYSGATAITAVNDQMSGNIRLESQFTRIGGYNSLTANMTSSAQIFGESD